MTDKEKLEKIKSLADKMYSRMAYLKSDTRPIRQAMDEYNKFIVNEYHKEDPVSEDLEEAARQFATDTETGKVDVVKQSSFFWGAIYHKQQMMAKAVDGVAMPYDAELWLGSQNDLKEFAEGEEVKVIVIKKDEL